MTRPGTVPTAGDVSSFAGTGLLGISKSLLVMALGIGIDRLVHLLSGSFPGSGKPIRDRALDVRKVVVTLRGKIKNRRQRTGDRCCAHQFFLLVQDAYPTDSGA